MSGLSGHMMHPHEDIKITKMEYNYVVAAALGHIHDAVVKEKVDGFGFQFAIVGDSVHLVRSKRDLCCGGIPLKDIDERMAHNPSARYKYNIAIRAVQELFLMNPQLLHSAKQWPCTYNCEVIQPGITNIISYNRGWKVYIHNCWERTNVEDKPNVTSYGEFFENMKQISSGPIELTPEITQQPRCSREVHLALMRRLDELFGRESSLREVYKNSLMRYYGFGNIEAGDIIDYIFKNDPKNLRDLKREYGEEDFTRGKLSEYYDFVIKRFDDFDLAIGDLAIDNDGRMHSDMANALLEKLNNETALKQWKRWRKINFHIGNTEGITINDKYKFTGNFGPLNQLIGMVQYNNTVDNS